MCTHKVLFSDALIINSPTALKNAHNKRETQVDLVGFVCDNCPRLYEGRNYVRAADKLILAELQSFLYFLIVSHVDLEIYTIRVLFRSFACLRKACKTREFHLRLQKRFFSSEPLHYNIITPPIKTTAGAK